MAKHDKDLDLQTIELPTAPEVSDNDFLVLKDVSSDALLSKTKVGDMRTVFGSGYPNVEDLADGDIQPPEWTLEGIDGAWRVTVTSVVPDAVCYIVYWFDAYITGQWIPAKEGGIWEFRQNASEGVLQLTIRAPIEDPPVRVFRIFKIRSVSATEKGPLSEKKEAFTKIYLPEDFTPNQPSLDTTGGFPYITYYPMDPGHFAYTISMRILAPAGQKNYIKQYKILRATDSGTGSFDGTEPYVEIKGYDVKNKTIPPSKFPFIDTDADLTAGWKYRYQVVAIALNDKPSEPSTYQETTLTDDTTAPDTPVFTVTEEDLMLRLDFYEPTQNSGDPCPDWKCYQVKVKKDAGAWEYIGPEDGLLMENYYWNNIGDGSLGSDYRFKARAFDHTAYIQWLEGAADPANASAWCGETDPAKAKKITGDAVVDRTIDAGHIILKALTNAEIADLTILAAKLADGAVEEAKLAALAVSTGKLANLAITETKVGNLAISTGKLQANCVETSKLAALAVEAGNIAALAITTGKLAANAVEAAKIAAGAIETGKLAALCVVADKIAANAVNLSKINFTPLVSEGGTGEIILTINASAEEGVRIGGGKLAIDSFTTFTNDVKIQGILNAAGGIKTSIGNNRLELGTWDSMERLRMYSGGNLAADLFATYAAGWYAAGLLLKGISGANQRWSQLTHAALIFNTPGSGTSLEMVNLGTSAQITLRENDAGKVGIDKNGLNLLGGAVYKVSGNQVVGARQAAVGDPDYPTADPTQWSECVHKNDCIACIVQFRALLDRLGTPGHGLTAD